MIATTKRMASLALLVSRGGDVALVYALTLFEQAADGLSTYLALSTGRAREQNELLLTISQALDWSVISTVLAAKALTAWLFWLTIRNRKATLAGVCAMAGLAAYISHIVAMNFYWAWVLR